VTPHRFDRFAQQPPALIVDLGDELLDRQLGSGDVIELCLKRGQPLRKLLRFGQRLEVHRGH
jgi:hypothetical protein